MSKFSSDEACAGMFLVAAPAGGGKTALAHTLSQQCHEKGHLVACFFFSETGQQCSLDHLVAQIIRGLYRIPDIKAVIATLIEKDETLIDAPAIRQLDGIVIPAAKDVKSDRPYVVTIDAVDEGPIDDLVIFLRDYIPRFPPPFRFLVTTRPKHEIMGALEECPHTTKLQFPMTGNDNACLKDVKKHIISKLNLKRYGSKILNDSDLMEGFVKTSEGVFLWAETVLQYLDKLQSLDPHKELQLIASSRSTYWMTVEDGTAKLYNLYQRILSQLKLEEPGFKMLYQTVLGTVLVLDTELSTLDLGDLFDSKGYHVEDVQRFCELIRPILHDYHPDHPERPVRILHFSVKEYVMERAESPYQLRLQEAKANLSHLVADIIDKIAKNLLPGFTDVEDTAGVALNMETIARLLSPPQAPQSPLHTRRRLGASKTQGIIDDIVSFKFRYVCLYIEGSLDPDDSRAREIVVKRICRLLGVAMAVGVYKNNGNWKSFQEILMSCFLKSCGPGGDIALARAMLCVGIHIMLSQKASPDRRSVQKLLKEAAELYFGKESDELPVECVEEYVLCLLALSGCQSARSPQFAENLKKLVGILDEKLIPRDPERYKPLLSPIQRALAVDST
ncbi:hypothetical protein FA15DRAFT_419444 [Coprinopsis marcescibilis]|uniref:Nephrocystin 3-like N-terminal domain-containing protein n=1 Tax=Coprinopsis marcescibilis TaxID=230819 RepID=A0A5C3KVG6_COPMA|nr:hypothetical protein FA15DRAFT_419444 [Coprinopsis marcescibilis]